MEDNSHIEQAQKLLRDACAHLGLQSDVTLVQTKGHRWTIDFEQDPAKPDFGAGMIKLERLLQEATRSPIDLRLEGLEDKNRRMKRNVLWGKDGSK